MMTIVTHVVLKPGTEPEWDVAMRARFDAAKGRDGWVSGQILMPLNALNKRVIVGTWRTRADWEAWHGDEAFAETRERLKGLETETSEQWWHEVLLDARAE
ncbi:MAG: antibiotic biosynthesis monooxygenase [Chloroflexi bacterium]|nr:antibiotic biosynthesis monooxygenase [Chloroflexota bacterium]